MCRLSDQSLLYVRIGRLGFSQSGGRQIRQCFHSPVTRLGVADVRASFRGGTQLEELDGQAVRSLRVSSGRSRAAKRCRRRRRILSDSTLGPPLVGGTDRLPAPIVDTRLAKCTERDIQADTDRRSDVGMANNGFWHLSAAELLAGYARREFSPVEVLDELLDRIDRLNPLLRAYLAINEDDARQAAAAAERAWRLPDEKPPLCGVPVSVKDTIEMRGLPTTYGSLAFKNNYQEDSEIVLRLRRAGAVIVGKTNTPEFALLGAVRNRLGNPGSNPWDLDHTCGGSSGGAAAAVAAALGPLAVGTDSAGSIRAPAAYNGVFGLKPTYQRIPSVQRWRAAPGRSHNGPLARTVRDAALLMQALAGFESLDVDSGLEPVADFLDLDPTAVLGSRVAVSNSLAGQAEVDPEALQLLDEAAELLRSLGCQVRQDDPPLPSGGNELEPGVWGYCGDHYAAAESLTPGFWERHADDLTDYARPIYEAGRRALAWQYRQLLRRNQAYREQMTEWFRSYDFLITPVAGAAPRHDEGRVGEPKRPTFPFLAPFNTTRNPAAAVPVGFHSRGLPLAIQIVGQLGDDLGVLRLSSAIEAARPWVDRWPALAHVEVAATL